VGVCSGFPDAGNFDWSTGGDGSGGVGDGGATGDGGVGAGGDFGQFRNVTISVFREDGTQLGSASTDNVKGMVTIRPGTYKGQLRVELRGGAGAEYFEEGRNRFVPFPSDRVIRVIVPRIDKNIGITPFTEAAYQLLTQGSAPESVGTATPTAAQINAANQRVAELLNQQFPKALEVADITRLPFIKSSAVPPGSLSPNARGIYGVVNGAFSKQAALFNTSSTTPTLDAVAQLAQDLRDGVLDGRNGSSSAAPADKRTYDPQTLASEISSALAHQAERFGNQAIKDSLPPVLNFGGTRYEGYLFDSSVPRNRRAVSTVAGWLAGNTLNLTVGQPLPKAMPAGQSVYGMISNFGHGGAFFKIDNTDTTLDPVYRVYALGDNVNGEMATGNQVDTDRQLVEVTLPGPMTHAAGGFAHTVMRLADGRVFAVGDNTFGQLGQGVGGTVVQRSSTPLLVNLPASAGGAVAVAATSVASYALMADGSVYTWGSNGGFGLLGNGSATGLQAAPIPVPGLSDVVQITARDNDVLVLKRDQSIWQWGSHPAAVNAYTDGDLTAAYRGGNFNPTQVAGLPSTTVGGRTAPVAVRKIITEQGLFAALLANGQVYSWGVHFDLSAKAILRDLTAARVLGLPPLRDMMPGGFVGYGARPFDRLTAMGVDYRGGMWKIRGRVAERFDPANPAQQRRPQTGVPRSADCATCHTFLDQPLETLRERQLAEAPVASSAAVCAPPSSVHLATNGTSLIRNETECILCHNPSRLNPAYAGIVAPAFVSSAGWPNCNKPTNLPPRDNVPAAPITNSCTVPVGHVFTPPGTTCSSCHNSVTARALQDLNPPCAQPESNELPTLATVATIVNVVNDSGVSIAQGAYTSDTTPSLQGTLSQALSGAQTLQVLRNGNPAGNASASGTNWNYTDGGAPQGTVVYTVRVVQGTGFGARSNPWTVRVDNVPPPAQPSILNLVDDTLGVVADGSFATDSTPTLAGTLSVAPDAGDVLQVLRNGTLVGTATFTGSDWTFVEPAALVVGSYSYTVRMLDQANNVGTTSAARSFVLIGGVPGASIGNVVNDGGVTIAAGSTTADATPSLSGSLTAALPAGHVLRVLRNGASVGTATVSGTSWTYVDNAPQGSVSYAVQVAAGSVVGGASPAYAFSVDSIVPTQVALVTEFRDRFIGALTPPAITADQTPTINGTLSAVLAANEQLRLRRTNTRTAAVVDTVLSPTGTSWTFSEITLLAQDTYTYQVQVFDTAGNTTAFSAPLSLQIDLTAAPLPTAGSSITTLDGATPVSGSIGWRTNATPVLVGTLARALNTGEVVAVYRTRVTVPATPAARLVLPAGNVTGTSWTYTNTTLADGEYRFQVRVELATNSNVFGPDSNQVSMSLDTAVPTQVALVTEIRDRFIGVLTPPAITADQLPVINGTLSAALAANEQLRLRRTNTRTGAIVNTVLSPTGTTWTFSETTPLAQDTYTYQVQVFDAAGNTSAFSATVSLQIALSAVPLPTAGVGITTLDGATPVSGSIGARSNATPILVGTLARALNTGEVVAVYRTRVTVPATPAVRLAVPAGNVSGTSWTFTNTTLSDGDYRFQARVELAANTSVFGPDSNVVSMTLDTVAPTQVALVTEFRDRFVGVLTPPAVTSDQLPVINGTLSAALGANEQLRLRRTNTRTGAIVNTVLSPTGTTWTFSETTPLAQDTYTYQVQVFDAAGNATAFSATLSLQIDLAAVPLPTAGIGITTLDGVVPVANSVGLRNNASPVLVGTLARALNTGEVVAVYRTRVTVPATAAARLVVPAVNVTSNSWTYTNTTLSDGDYRFLARVELASNTSVFGPDSSLVSMTLDATAPTQTVGSLNLADPGLISVNGGNTAATSLTVTGNMSANLGTGEVLQIVRTGTNTGTLTRTVTGAVAAGWTFAETGLAVDSYAYTVRVRDAAGNLGTASNVSVNVIAALPTISGSLSVTGASGGFVGTSTPTVTGFVSSLLPGTPPPGGNVRIFRNGVSAGTATVTGTSFTFTDSARAQGSTVTYTARVENGSAYSATSSGVAVTIDTTAPSQTASVLSASSSVMPNTTVTGAVPPNATISNGGTTNDNSPRLNVQLSAALGVGESLRIKRSGINVTYTSIGSCGTNCFIIDVPSPVTLTNNEGGGAVTNTIPAATSGTSAAYTAVVVDALSREGTVSAAFSMTFNYFGCDLTRANVTYAAANGGVNHPSWTNLNCSSCHQSSTTSAPTPSGALVRVPPSGTYWCRRP
jgi:hypothetical protein